MGEAMKKFVIIYIVLLISMFANVIVSAAYAKTKEGILYLARVFKDNKIVIGEVDVILESNGLRYKLYLTKNVKLTGMDRAKNEVDEKIVLDSLSTHLGLHKSGRYRVTAEEFLQNSPVNVYEIEYIGPNKFYSNENVRNSDATKVYEAQTKLIFLGYKPGIADGIMGAKTQKAIINFQKNNNLPSTGKLDSDTRDALFEYESNYLNE
jgi:hypothetical protein